MRRPCTLPPLPQKARTMFDEALTAAARVSKAWPFQEAMKLVKRYPDGKPDGEAVLFETGYGPSGLPHIGTFQEVLRTTLVRRAWWRSATTWTGCARCPTTCRART